MYEASSVCLKLSWWLDEVSPNLTARLVGRSDTNRIRTPLLRSFTTFGLVYSFYP